MELSGKVLVSHAHSPRVYATAPPKQKSKTEQKRKTLSHQQDKQLQGKLTGCQGKGTKAQTHQLDSSRLFNAQEKHLKALE